MASVYPSTQWSTVKRGELSCFAASDIVAGAAVRIASSGDWTVQMVQAATEKPIGVARDFAAAGQPVSVWDYGNIRRDLPAMGSVTRQSYVGVVGTSSMTHPISGVAATYPLLGLVVSGGSPVGGSQAAVWAVGVAWESAATGDTYAYRIEPALLSGVMGA